MPMHAEGWLIGTVLVIAVGCWLGNLTGWVSDRWGHVLMGSSMVLTLAAMTLLALR